MRSKDEPVGAVRAPRIEPLTRLATGGMAEIWLARELGAAGFERFVVVKRLLPHLAHDRHVVDMFASEARFVARLAHPNVVQIHELGQDEQGYFLVMEYVEGCSVRELTGAVRKAGNVLAPDIGVCIVEQALRGVHAAHELTDPSGKPLGLVHRDISPHNLMISPQGDVKLLDFGIAKATEAAEATQTGSLKGKYGYMAPEQCRAMPLDRRSDVFATGIVLWELLVGERLFDRGSEYDSLQAIVSGDVRPPSEARPDLPRELDAVVMKALANDLVARWQTADELRRALRAAAEAAGLRPSRDALAATVAELLGERLEQRARLLRDFAHATAGVDPDALRDALVASEPSPKRSPTETSGGTGSRPDDVATVVQRRSSRPAREDTAMDTTRTIGQAAALSTPMEPAARARPARRIAVALGALVALAAVALVAMLVVHPRARVASAPGARDEPALVGPPLRFVVAPTVQREVILGELAPFARWLERELGRPVEVIVAQSYEQSGELVSSGSAEFGLLPPLLFVQASAREPRLRALVLRLYDGSRGNDAYLVARDDSQVANAQGLRGRTVCLVDRESTTGFLLPRIWMRDAGLDPDKDVRTVISGDHLAALRDLSSHRCDAAAVYSGAYLSARQQGIEVGAMRILAITGRAPQDVIAAAPDVADADAVRLRDALLAFQPQRDIDASRIGEVLGISGFAPFEPADFDRVRDAARREGMLPGPGAPAPAHSR